MDHILISGENQLHGEIAVQGSKNIILPILAAALLNDGIVSLTHCPYINDVHSMLLLLQDIGCYIIREKDRIIIDTRKVHSCELKKEYAKRMRSSIVLTGALLGKFGRAVLYLPGGCSIGARPIDMHLDALKRMNVAIQVEEDKIICDGSCMEGNIITLPFPSVGATQNTILAAVKAKGVTIINNAAKEPEIEELCRFLISMGAVIKGHGTSKIKIKGVSRLHDTEYRIVADRIAAGTYMAAVIGAGGRVAFHMDCMSHMQATLRVFRKMSATIRVLNDGIIICSKGNDRNIPLIQTKPYPGFPTDMQSIVMTLLTVGKGVSVMEEKIFEARFKTAPELIKMGADVVLHGNSAYIRGVPKLKGTDVETKELRGGAALVVAGLMAEGMTRIEGISHIERGYEDICGVLGSIGADIRYKKESGR